MTCLPLQCSFMSLCASYKIAMRCCGKIIRDTVYNRRTNIQTLQHALCWTPATPNLNVAARVLPKVMLGVWFLSSIAARALQMTLTLNFGGEGVVPDRRGLKSSSIYGTNWCVCACRVPQLELSRSLMFSLLFGLQTLLWKHRSACCWSCSKLRETLPFHKWRPPVCLPSHFFHSLIRNWFQAAGNVVFSQVSATFVLPVPGFSIL